MSGRPRKTRMSGAAPVLDRRISAPLRISWRSACEPCRNRQPGARRRSRPLSQSECGKRQCCPAASPLFALIPAPQQLRRNNRPKSRFASPYSFSCSDRSGRGKWGVGSREWGVGNLITDFPLPIPYYPLALGLFLLSRPVAGESAGRPFAAHLIARALARQLKGVALERRRKQDVVAFFDLYADDVQVARVGNLGDQFIAFALDHQRERERTLALGGDCGVVGPFERGQVLRLGGLRGGLCRGRRGVFLGPFPGAFDVARRAIAGELAVVEFTVDRHGRAPRVGGDRYFVRIVNSYAGDGERGRGVFYFTRPFAAVALQDQHEIDSAEFGAVRSHTVSPLDGVVGAALRRLGVALRQRRLGQGRRAEQRQANQFQRAHIHR